MPPRRRVASVPARVPRDFQRSYRARLQVWKQITLPGLVLILVFLLVRLLGLMQSAELKSLDFLLRYQPFESQDPRITLVGITQDDITRLDRYPVTDTNLSQVLRTLDDAKPRVIGLNLLRDVKVPPGYDEILETFDDLENLVSIELIGPTGEITIPSPPRVSPDRIGFSNVLEDKDWHLRRALLSGSGEGDNVKYAFGVRLAQQYLAPMGYRLEAQKSKNLLFTPPEGRRKISVHTFYPNLGGYAREKIIGKAKMLRFRQGQEPFKVLTLTQVLEDKFDKNWVRDRIVIIGNVASGSKDVFLAPGLRHSIWSQTENYQGNIPFLYGLEIHAQVTSQVISTTLGERADIWALPGFFEYGLIIMAGILGTGLGIFLASPLGRLVGLAVFGAGFILLAYVSLGWGLWLPLIPCLAAFTGVGFSTLFVDRELWLRYEQANATLEYAYNAVHNGPLQSLIVILRQVARETELHEQLSDLNTELRTIYESIRDELNRSGQQFTLGQRQLNADEPLMLLLDQTHNIALGRELPGFETIVVFMSPQLNPFKDVFVSNQHKQQICYFLEEAIYNVGKHANQAERLDVLGLKDKRRFHLQIVDDGYPSVTPSSVGNDCYAESSSQGTRQMQAIAEIIGGQFRRVPNYPHGTVCQLSWPQKPPLVRQIGRLLSKL